MQILDRSRLADLMAREQAAFVARHPRAGALHERARRSLLDGVPMNWMIKWAGAYPLYVETASGAHFSDVDGHDYVDFCLGDTGAMAGHGAAPTIAAVERQLRRGITHMLPTEDAIWAGEELTRRFGLPYWQFALTATDANRWSLRLARHITGRPLVAVHDRNYHGSVDETFASLADDGRVEARRGNLGPQVDPARTTRVVPFNDLDALERGLADGQVAALLIEPALTNVGIVLPEPGYLEGVREITRRHGTILIHDETHTICAGPGGITGAGGYEPDMLVIGKTIGGGIPVATYGMSAEVAARVSASIDYEDSDVGGIGGTLAGYALSLAAVRATLGEVLTAGAFARMLPLAERWAAGVDEVIRRHDVPWHVTRLGARAEYHFMPTPPRNGREQWDHSDPELERFLHLWAMNRGILMTPFHNMALMSPATSTEDVDLHTEVFEGAASALFD
ncbi:MAG: aminotransferase class III-fold pyridoxal phosphate-dependent enzyme [Chloroflexi bacterium]|nr:aminotransferase class III-fold pyridoxal phosphate-dependent enzyme [Chloroflexota bacterium]